MVIATRNRRALLAETLDALSLQTAAPAEVVVVDDGSDDGSGEMAAARGHRVLRTRHGGPARARQEGWLATTTPVVAFTDDDCRPTPGWLESLVAPIRAGTADLVQGRTVPRPDHLDRAGPWSRTQAVDGENGFYQTCNIAYRRDVLVAVGGFDPAFHGPRTSGEDTDLAWRAKERGYRSAFAPDAVVEHVVWPSSYRAFLRDRRRWGMVVLTLKHHPQLRRLAYRRWFYRPSHARTLAGLAVLAGAATVRRWLPFALGAGVAAAYAARGPRPAARLLHLVEVAVADAYEVGVFVAASVRYRTLLL